ncbi:EAL domain-containing protein [Sulfurimonas sp.]|uniref:EAL domain-containing protein n=1 Tax=Sulfurimonas sp. TaxID=2022749 RepID=UPI00261B09C9|nr:EAL domain-containing protein [Sulfurimonas sp.]
MKQLNIIYSFFVVLLLFVLVYLYVRLGDFELQAKKNIESVIIKNTSYFIENVEKNIKQHVKSNLYKSLKSNPQLRKELETNMGMLITPSFKYIYVLYRDSAGKYRYLLDGSKEEKGLFDMKFDIDTQAWDSVYLSKEKKIVTQDDVSSIWITTLYPIVYDGEVQGVIALDFSTSLFQYISKVLSPLKDIFLYVFVATFSLLVVILYQMFLQLKTKRESITDPLTKAYNRVYLRDLVEKINLYNYDVAMLDLDHFKKVNDNFGHDMGDYVLVNFVKLLQKSIRSKDIIIRFGGEEFLLFLYKEKKKESQATEVMQRVLKTVSQYNFVYENSSLQITCSAGLVKEAFKYNSVQQVIKKADERLYSAKSRGRNRIVESDISACVDRLSLGAVKQALDEERLLCHFQPIFTLSTKKIAKYEALVRLRGEGEKLYYPNQFLDTIEGTNVYRDLTKNVLEIVFEKIAEHQIAMSMNLNLSDIIDNSIYEMLIKELEASKSLAQFLTIELLEYESLANDILLDRIVAIKSYGVKIALDDFGSGYSNFSIFENLPIDIIKIDGSLVKNIDNSKTSYIIVESIARLAKRLGLVVIAEFVHSKAVLDVLEELDVRCGQGFYLGKPDILMPTGQ